MEENKEEKKIPTDFFFQLIKKYKKRKKLTKKVHWLLMVKSNSNWLIVIYSYFLYKKTILIRYISTKFIVQLFNVLKYDVKL